MYGGMCSGMYTKACCDLATTATSTATAALPKAGGTMTGDITFNAGQTFPGTVTSIPTASTSQAGIVQLNSAIDSTSDSEAGTANAVKDAYDRGSLGVTNAAAAQVTADAALPKSGGTMTGQITFVADQVWPAGSGSVTSVNTKTGTVVLNADDVAALPIAGSPEPDSGSIDWQIPLYVIHGALDRVIPLGPSQAVVNQLKSSGKPIEFIVLDGVSHYEIPQYGQHLAKAIPWVKEAWNE